MAAEEYGPLVKNPALFTGNQTFYDSDSIYDKFTGSDTAKPKVYLIDSNIEEEFDFSDERRTAVLLEGVETSKVNLQNVEANYIGLIGGEIDEVDISGAEIDLIYDDNPNSREYLTDSDTRVEEIGMADIGQISADEAGFWEDCMNLEMKHSFLGAGEIDPVWTQLFDGIGSYEIAGDKILEPFYVGKEDAI